MDSLQQAAEAFVAMAHRIVWCNAASVDVEGRPRSRVLHPIWDWDGKQLTGWIATSPTATKRQHFQAHPYLSLNYWHPDQDTCVAECRAQWAFDVETKRAIWEKFKAAPEPVGYDPAIVPAWAAPEADNFAVIKLEPWRLRVFPGTLLLKGEGTALNWEED
tara:strand:+ start:2842 stop:3324 length:483 start_codon:yes stop_codon:yes gene_type:complete